MLDLVTKSCANALTLTNLVFGSGAIVAVQNQNYKLAGILILCAVFMDGMDGKIARKLGSTSELGKELDSLCDLVSFGVAPAVLLYAQVLGSSFHLFGLLAAMFYIVCGALRLARFNVLNIHDYFVGVPITIAGLILALLSLLAGSIAPIVLFVSIFILSLLMISNFKVPKF
ncbi:MAG: CDP-diacylglycerol--serine O-phosphatidyltransferase [Syntrophomonadaceae bacterium]|nr:CDP-diacylglycerol--serine O-phosphatidyltransferase [Syntrophomonadaceae bacterium]